MQGKMSILDKPVLVAPCPASIVEDRKVRNLKKSVFDKNNLLFSFEMGKSTLRWTAVCIMEDLSVILARTALAEEQRKANARNLADMISQVSKICQNLQIVVHF